jgi:CTP:molybdopterin cytidylyltransferase MocA
MSKSAVLVDPVMEAFPLILLAGGKSQRMGTPKGLLRYRNRFWLLEQCNRYKAAGGKRIILVLGFHWKDYLEQIFNLSEEVQNPIFRMGLEISVVVNAQPELGPFSSLQCAVTVLMQGDYPGAFVLPIDVPGPDLEVFRNMARSFEDGKEALIPRYRTKGGHPVLLSRTFLNRLSEISPESETARLDFQIRALPREKVAYLSVIDEKVRLNLNKPEDFLRYSEGGV